MYWHQPTRTAFLANPRTASRSVAAALKGVGFTMIGSHHSGLDRSARRVFTVVRHHCDCIVSWGEHLSKPVRDEASLRVVLDFMERQNLYDDWQLERRLFPWVEVATRVMRFEELVQGATLMLAPYPPIQLPHIGESDRPAWRDFFTPTMEAMVWARYANEAARLGYTDFAPSAPTVGGLP